MSSGARSKHSEAVCNQEGGSRLLPHMWGRRVACELGGPRDVNLWACGPSLTLLPRNDLFSEMGHPHRAWYARSRNGDALASQAREGKGRTAATASRLVTNSILAAPRPDLPPEWRRSRPDQSGGWPEAARLTTPFVVVPALAPAIKGFGQKTLPVNLTSLAIVGW